MWVLQVEMPGHLHLVKKDRVVLGHNVKEDVLGYAKMASLFAGSTVHVSLLLPCVSSQTLDVLYLAPTEPAGASPMRIAPPCDASLPQPCRVVSAEQLHKFSLTSSAFLHVI